jgi:hypothetical protein
MRRVIRESGALALVSMALFWSVLVPAAIANGAPTAAPQAAAGWPECRGTTLSHCFTYACINNREVIRYWVVWKNILDHEYVGPVNSCGIV